MAEDHMRSIDNLMFFTVGRQTSRNYEIRALTVAAHWRLQFLYAHPEQGSINQVAVAINDVITGSGSSIDFYEIKDELDFKLKHDKWSWELN